MKMNKKGQEGMVILLVVMILVGIYFVFNSIIPSIQDRAYNPKYHICDKIDPSCDIFSPLFQEGYCCKDNACEVGGCLEYHRAEECDEEGNRNNTEKCTCEEIVFTAGTSFDCNLTKNYRFYENSTKDITPEIQFWCNYATTVNLNEKFETTTVTAKRCREKNDFDLNCTKLWKKYDDCPSCDKGPLYLNIFNLKKCQPSDLDLNNTELWKNYDINKNCTELWEEYDDCPTCSSGPSYFTTFNIKGCPINEYIYFKRGN